MLGRLAALLWHTPIVLQETLQLSNVTFSSLLEYVGKFGALFASIPFTIFAAVYCVMFGLVGKQVSFLPQFCFPPPSLSSLLCNLTNK